MGILDSDKQPLSTCDLSVIIPVFNEEESLEKLFENLEPVLRNISLSWEVILVDDGSHDRSWDIICDLNRRFASVKGVRFSRNFGHQYALFAGFEYSRGEMVVSMDADLQHPPEVIPEFIKLFRQGYAIVNSVRIEPENISWFKKKTSGLYYRIFSFLSGIDMGSGMADFRLLSRSVVNHLLEYREEGLFLRGIIQTLGYRQISISYQCQDRYAGRSKYTVRKMIRLAWTGVISFSIVPLRISILMGVLTSGFAFYQLIDVFYVRLFTDRAVPGWASSVGLISLMFGILFILLGIIGEYIGRILIEVRNRPRYLIRDKIGVAKAV